MPSGRDILEIGPIRFSVSYEIEHDLEIAKIECRDCHQHVSFQFDCRIFSEGAAEFLERYLYPAQRSLFESGCCHAPNDTIVAIAERIFEPVTIREIRGSYNQPVQSAWEPTDWDRIARGAIPLPPTRRPREYRPVNRPIPVYDPRPRRPVLARDSDYAPATSGYKEWVKKHKELV
jgi:hypothetical protein